MATASPDGSARFITIKGSHYVERARWALDLAGRADEFVMHATFKSQARSRRHRIVTSGRREHDVET